MEILNFVKEMNEKATKALLEVSEGGKSIDKTYQYQKGQAETITIWGGAIEKASITHLILKGVKAPGKDREFDAMVYHMKVFPENPYCPMGHFNTEWILGGVCSYTIVLDLFPVMRIEEDLETMRHLMDGVADKFGRDRKKMREGLDIQYNMEHWSFPLATGVGCKLLQLDEEDLDLLITAYLTFFNAYLDIFKKRKDAPFSEEEIRLKLERNGKWLEYFTLKDRAVKMAQVSGVPPQVLISLGFPPSAIF